MFFKEFLKSKLSPQNRAYLADPFGKIRAYKEDAYKDFYSYALALCSEKKEPKILEIGVAYPPDLILHLTKKSKSKLSYGININIKQPYKYQGINVAFGNTCDLKFMENTFNFIVSLNVLEHINNFNKAVLEWHRVLEPGGLLFAQFAPVWSSSFGHHLCLRTNNKLITYEDHILPPFCHLLNTENELFEIILASCPNLDQNDILKIIDYIFNSKDQNRLMLSDYKRIFENSDFEVISFKKIQCMPDTSVKYLSKMNTEILDKLSEKFPNNKDDFNYDGAQVLLRKKI